jgi:hypothetical protein
MEKLAGYPPEITKQEPNCWGKTEGGMWDRFICQSRGGEFGRDESRAVADGDYISVIYCPRK